MSTRRKKPNWSRVLVRVRDRAAAGDVDAMWDLGSYLFDGIQDTDGRCVVRRNSAYAVRLFRRAAESGDPSAACSLGYAYDVGVGIGRNRVLALKWYRLAARKGSTTAMANIATVYRDKGDLRRAHRWVLRGADMGDGDDAVSAGYGYLHGIGVRRDEQSARHMFHRAIESTDISEYGREEALYNLALAHVASGERLAAIPLLERANTDGDYPEATSLLEQITAETELRPCLCRRHLDKDLRGHADCPQHPVRHLRPRV
jgi:TPR repeat protein